MQGFEHGVPQGISSIGKQAPRKRLIAVTRLLRFGTLESLSFDSWE